MFEAILFDLDGTLLDIDMEFFLGKYFNEMGRMAAVAGHCDDSRRLVEQILQSTEVMMKDTDPQVSNEEVFMRHFFKSWDVDEVEMRAFFEEFYSIGFPRLEGYCKPFNGVPEMMGSLFARGYKVIVATNAVFPLQAIQLRMDWAGVGHFPFALVTSYENMHFCKPQLAYYEEITAKIGVDPSACLMVGNDADEDLAAGEVGMKTFLVQNRLIDRGKYSYNPDWEGNLQDLYLFLEEIDEKCGA